jgi:hypothetical protein
MDKELKEDLLENFPKIFKQKNVPIQIENGWYSIVLDVCVYSVI